MRLRACMSGLVLGATACAGLPEQVRIDVDGRTIEVRQRGLSGKLLSGGWSTEAMCGDGNVETVEVLRASGETLKLYRCIP